MSDSIQAFKIIEMSDLIIPMWTDDFEVEYSRDNHLTVNTDEGDGLKGVLTVEGRIAVSELSFYGAGSEHGFYTFIELLERSTGHLDAVIVWENDQVIQRLRSIEGAVTITTYDVVELIRAYDLSSGDKPA